MKINLLKMKKYVVVRLNDIKQKMQFKIGTQLLIRGKAFSLSNSTFYRDNLRDWIKQLREKNELHPAIPELKKLLFFLTRNGIDAVLV